MFTDGKILVVGYVYFKLTERALSKRFFEKQFVKVGGVCLSSVPIMLDILWIIDTHRIHF